MHTSYIFPGWIILAVWNSRLQRMLLAIRAAWTKAARCPWEEAGADSGHVTGTRNAVYVWYPRGRDAQPGLLNSAHRSSVTAFQGLPEPALIPPVRQYLCVPEPQHPGAEVLNCPSRQMAGNGCGSDNMVKINLKYLEMPLYQAASATWVVKVSLKRNKDRARQTLGFQLLKLKIQEHQQVSLCTKSKNAAYKLHHKRRRRKKKEKKEKTAMAINVPKIYVTKSSHKSPHWLVSGWTDYFACYKN